MPNDDVTVAYVHPNEIAHSFHQSLIAMFGHDLEHHGRLARGGWLAVRCYGADGIPAARNFAVKEFLKDKTADWLLFIDTDMGFAPDTIDKLLEVADPEHRPIVGALCFAQKVTDSDGKGGWKMQMAPTLFNWHDEGTPDSEIGFLSSRYYPINSLVRVAGTGAACIMIHRNVLLKMRDKFGEEWYTRCPNPTAGGRMLGEDLSFCLRAGVINTPVFVHTGVKTTHFKTIWLSEQDYWFWMTPEPATEQTAIIVPVMKRPQNAESFMRSARASSGLVNVYAVCDEDDVATKKAWKDSGAKVLVLSAGERPGTFAEKVNYGYRRTDEPWMFIVGDDVRFYPGWLDHAQHTANSSTNGYHVIGTNDLGNPRSTDGEHSAHLLIRRSYVDEQGGGWDGPKSIAHEGYRHWYVDDEIVTAAKQRNAFAMAMGSTVEHLHPLWGKGDDDDVYRLGQSFAMDDLETFKRRLLENGPEFSGDQNA